jgi:hypothetical protein
MFLFSKPRRRMRAVHGHERCIIGLDITTLIGFAPRDAVGPVGPSTRCLALRPIEVVVELGVRYQSVLELARAPGDLDIKGFCRVGRASEARLDIISTISIPEVDCSGVR